MIRSGALVVTVDDNGFNCNWSAASPCFVLTHGRVTDSDGVYRRRCFGFCYHHFAFAKKQVAGWFVSLYQLFFNFSENNRNVPKT